MAKDERSEERSPPASNRRLRAYVGAVVAASVGALVLFSPPLTELVRVDFWLWLLVCLGAEFLWLETISREATDSMASTVNLAVIYLFGFGLSLWIVGVSVFFATRFIQKRNMVKSVFGFSQMVLTTLLAGLVFKLTGGEVLHVGHLRDPLALIPCVAAGVTYSVVNPGLVSVAVALERGLPILLTWKQNYGYRNYLLSTLALFVLSPLLLIAYLAVGWWGVLLFFLPMVIVKNQNREYIQLQRAQDALIATERFAAMGEIAGSIAHELRNYLQVINSRAEILIGRALRAGDAAMGKDAQSIREQVDKMTDQVQGLLQSVRPDVAPEPTDLNKLTVEVVEFNKAHNLFDNIDIQLDLDSRVGFWSADPRRFHQLLMNLLRNAGDAINGTEKPGGVIKVTSRIESRGEYHITVEDDGPGVPQDLRTKVFEPHFTTKRHGTGYGLATCYMIMEKHGGKLWVDESPTLGGACFHVSLPKARKTVGTSRSVLDGGASRKKRPEAQEKRESTEARKQAS